MLVLDEPFASLDTGGAAALTALVRNLVAGGTAVVVLSQAVDALVSCADHWMLLNDGASVGAGTPGATGQVPGTPRPPASWARNPPGPANRSPVSPGPSGRRRAVPAGVPALELRDVSFAYGRPPARRRFRRASAAGTVKPAVLDGVSLSVHPGEIVAVTGPNGAGKSTLLRHLNGLLQPLAGSVRINGQDIAGLLPGKVAADVGLLFQDPRDQLFERTAEREVGFGLAAGPAASASVQRALAAVGLAEAARHHPAELPASRQRLLGAGHGPGQAASACLPWMNRQ